MVADRLAEILDVRFARMQSRALVADTRHAGHRVILVKPQTFMNESGQAVAALQKFYKVPLEDMIVAFDEMDLPLGQIRIRPKGGSSGHNGMKSIIRRLGGNQAFPRIRLGIGRPPGRMPPPAYLLQDFSRDERETILPGLLDEGARALLAFVTEGLVPAMNRYNGEFSDRA
jgi:PTH1 family peptidyl-tRNA hydrolase